MEHNSLEKYFEEQIYKALEHQGLELSVFAVNYLLNLISYEALRSSEEDIYLFDLYKKSVEAKSKREKVAYLRRLGDHSLVTSGFFSRSLERKPVGLEYYISMGSAAYGSIRKPDLYMELSHKYRGCVAILNEVSESNENYCVKDIGRLYDMWLSTDSKAIKEELAMLGMITTEVFE